MTPIQTLAVAFATLVVTKAVDHFVDVFSDKRNFKRHRREKILSEIEELKDQLGVIYEIASNWKSFDSKQRDYVEQFSKESQILGKYNKYPKISMAARDVIHQCKIVAEIERKQDDDLMAEKEDMASKFAKFIEECELHLDGLV